MIAPQTAILLATVSTLAAVDVPFPVEISALVLVAGILRWLLRREDSVDAATLARIDTLESEVVDLRLAESEQRHEKHALRGEIAGLRGTFAVLDALARSCHCGALDPALPLLEALRERHET